MEEEESLGAREEKLDDEEGLEESLKPGPTRARPLATDDRRRREFMVANKGGAGGEIGREGDQEKRQIRNEGERSETGRGRFPLVLGKNTDLERCSGGGRGQGG